MAVKTHQYLALIHRSGTIQLAWPRADAKCRIATAALNILTLAFPSLMTIQSTHELKAWELAQYQRRLAERLRGL